MTDVWRRWPVVVALTVMWVALWGDVTFANVLGGLVVAVAVLWGFRGTQPRPTRHLRPVLALRYLITFLRQLVEASVSVALAVFDPDRVAPGIVAMPLRHASDAVVTLVANSITLTPGTLTLETEQRGDTSILYVHALDLRDADAVREDVCKLEVLAVDAFSGPDAQAEQARTLEGYERRVHDDGGDA